MEKNNKNTFMLLALEEAKIASSKGEVPVGAITVMNNEVLAKSSNFIESLSNPLKHAEMIVLENSSVILKEKGLSIRHVNLDLYVTLEPCAMCAYAISLCRIKNLFYGADDSKGGGVKFGSKVFDQTTCHHKPNIFSGINKKDCEQIIKSFFLKIRN